MNRKTIITPKNTHGLSSQQWKRSTGEEIVEYRNITKWVNTHNGKLIIETVRKCISHVRQKPIFIKQLTGKLCSKIRFA